MLLQVESRAGPHDEPEPLAFRLGDVPIAVLQITDRWIAHDCNYYRIEASDRAMYILRYAKPARQWELTLFQAPAG